MVLKSTKTKRAPPPPPTKSPSISSSSTSLPRVSDLVVPVAKARSNTLQSSKPVLKNQDSQTERKEYVSTEVQTDYVGERKQSIVSKGKPEIQDSLSSSSSSTPEFIRDMQKSDFANGDFARKVAPPDEVSKKEKVRADIQKLKMMREDLISSLVSDTSAFTRSTHPTPILNFSTSYLTPYSFLLFL